MIVRSPCPKCRQPMLPGVLKCIHCAYRLTEWEARRALWAFGLKFLLGCLLAGVLIYVIANN